MARNAMRLVVGAWMLMAPLAVRAQEAGWGYDSPGDPGYGQADVSVDMGVSGGVTMANFHAPLAAHGQWIVSSTYGQVWRPWVAAGWRPYYYGRWEWTSEGWLWVSDEPFGWAVYHYGRWAWDPAHGWVWVPGYQWAPAWVTWRYGPDAIGWAPLAPGFSIYLTSYPYYDYWWTFVPTVRFVGVPVYRAAYAPAYTRRWYGATAPAPPRAGPAPGRASPAPAWGGPAPRLIQERTGRPVTPVRVQPTRSPVTAPPRAGVVPVYRPEIGSPGRPAPADRGHGRGPGVAPAPGRGGSHEPAPPAGGRGRGPGVAPAQGRGGGYEPAPGGGRGPGNVAASAADRSPGAGPAAAPRSSPQASPAPGGGRGGGEASAHGGRGGGGGGGGGGGERGDRGDRQGR